MMKFTLSNKTTDQSQKPVFRFLALSFVGFFVTVITIASLWLIPKINHTIENQHRKDAELNMGIEAELLTRYMLRHEKLLSDLAASPVLVSSVMTSTDNDADMIDLLNHFQVDGEKITLILRDLSGKILHESNIVSTGRYKEDTPDFNKLHSNKTTVLVKLIRQDNAYFTFEMTIPVRYSGNIEGFLTGRFRANFTDIFTTSSIERALAYRLTQDDVIISTSTDGMVLPRAYELKMPKFRLTFSYIEDDLPILERKADIRNKILFIMLAGLTVSFLLFAYLTYRNYDEEAANVPRTQYLIPVFLMILGITGSYTAFKITKSLEETAFQKETILHSRSILNSIRNQLLGDLDQLYALRGLFDASDFVSRDEFKKYTAPILIRYPHIQALEWVPLVTPHNKQQYEKRAQSEGLREFFIKEKNTSDLMVPVSGREHYYPVFYVEPLIGNEQAVGFDLGSNPVRLKALLRARNHNEIILTSPVKLVQDPGNQRAVLAVLPVYRKDRRNRSAYNGVQSVRGYVLMVFRLTDFFKDSQRVQLGHENLILRDVTDSQNPQELYNSTTPGDDFLRYKHVINIGSRVWEFQISETDHYRPSKNVPLIVLICGIIFTTIICLSLIQLIRRRAIVETQVGLRTSELNEARKFLALIQNNNPDLVYVRNREGVVIEANDAYLSLFPKKLRNQIIGSKASLFTTEKDLKSQSLLDEKAYEEGENISFEEVILENSEVHIFANKRIAFKNDKGEEFLLTIARDETMREKLIEQLADSNEQLEQFAYICSHDLQEPMRMIGSFSQKLDTHLTKQLEKDEKGKKYLHFINDGAMRAQQLINDILAYSKISRDVRQYETVNVNKVVNDIISDLSFTLEENGGEITKKELPSIVGNKTQIVQIFQNLISNALKYHKQGAVPKVHISSKDKGEFYEFSVRDNGLGIEPKYHDRIFEVFKRLHRKVDYPGTGIGLAIVKRIVEAHGGDVSVSSQLDRGAVFAFTIPKSIVHKES